jgi:hypothetical protein
VKLLACAEDGPQHLSRGDGPGGSGGGLAQLSETLGFHLPDMACVVTRKNPCLALGTWKTT